MLPEPWFNFGLQWGADDNVVFMPKAFYETLTDDDFNRVLGGRRTYLTRAMAKRAWKALGNPGSPPAKMTIMVRWEAVEDAVARLGIRKL